MAEPSKKAPAFAQWLESMVGRTTAIEANKCVPPPFGCGKPAPPESFRDQLSRHEFTISGLCQACQDSVFGSMGDDDAE